MPCYHPLKAFQSSPGSRLVFVKSGSPQLANWQRLFDGKSPMALQVPCGKCIGCRLEYSRDWALRCMLEASRYSPELCWFLTLTYDNEHVPLRYTQHVNVDVGSGEFLGLDSMNVALTLQPSDLHSFFNSLRKHEERLGRTGVRFFAAGEYGDLSRRPHYHAIVFNLRLDDLRPNSLMAWSIQTNGSRFPLFESPTLNSIWHRGNVCVAQCNFDTCAYVARYITKKQKGLNAKSYYDELGVHPEFSRCSRRPGTRPPCLRPGRWCGGR